ncbi:uncharacterized protein [Centruroides vittatus]|uniref:uncharacterized protein n=1 Tax=Centruroides vittatus TaxID=120091 RepID=UPI00351031ED
MAVAQSEIINLPCRMANQIPPYRETNSNKSDTWIFVAPADGTVDRLKDQLQTAHSNIAFLQEQHSQMLIGLHQEIGRLQRNTQDLQRKLELSDLLVDEAPLRKRISELELEVAHCCQRSDFLSKELENANNVIAALDRKLKLQEWQHQNAIEEQKKIISRLEYELELKCSKLAELNSKLNNNKKRSFFQKMSFSTPRLPSVTLPPFPKSRMSLDGASARSSPSPTYQEARSYSLPDSGRLPSIQLSQFSGDSEFSRRSQCQSLSSSTLSNESLCNGFYEPRLSSFTDDTSQNGPPSIEKVGSSYLQHISSIVQFQPTIHSVELKNRLPHLHSGSSQRSHVRRQIRVHREAQVPGLKPNKLNPPEDECKNSTYT